MTRDHLNAARLVDGVWTTDGAVEIAGQTLPAVVTWREPGVKVRNMRCIPEPDLSEIVFAVTMDADEARRVAEHVLAQGRRTVFAAVALDGSGVWAIGDTEQEARTFAGERRLLAREDAQAFDLDFPPPETDAAWLDGFAIITLSGTTDSLRALIKSMETGDPVAPWCPADLWDDPEPSKEP